MSFFSFNEKYYRGALSALEAKTPGPEEIYRAKQLLKVLDDLTDEGYTELNTRMEAEFSCLTRLRAYLKRAGATPFPMPEDRLPETPYRTERQELAAFSDTLIEAARGHAPSGEPFLERLRAYCAHIGYEEGTAYVFLFRDALLPYLCFRSRGRKGLYPWLISRAFAEDITGESGADDALRAPIYDAPESGRTDYRDFFPFVRERVLEALGERPKLKEVLTGLLASVKEERIVVVESGYCGTFPLALAALDSRVRFTMYTTAPYLFETYRDVAFCTRYEDIRRFETLWSQERLMRYAGFCGGRFYVHASDSPKVWERAFGEIAAML